MPGAPACSESLAANTEDSAPRTAPHPRLSGSSRLRGTRTPLANTPPQAKKPPKPARLLQQVRGSRGKTYSSGDWPQCTTS